MTLAESTYQAGDNLPSEYQQEVERLLTIFVDSTLAGAAGFSEQINAAPGLRQRQIAVHIVADKLKHAETILGLLSAFGIEPDQYVQQHQWQSRLERNVDYGNQRIGDDKRLNVFHYPITDWTDALAMNLLMSSASYIQAKALSESSYLPLADAMRLIEPTERRHMELAVQGLESMIYNGEKSACQQAVDYWYPRVLDSFGHTDSKTSARQLEFKLLRTTNTGRCLRWQQQIEQYLDHLQLKLPA